MKKKQRENNLGKILKCQEMERKAGIKEIYYITRSFLVRRAQDIRKRRKIFVKMISRKIEEIRERERKSETLRKFHGKKEIFVFLLCFDKSLFYQGSEISPPQKKHPHFAIPTPKNFFK